MSLRFTEQGLDKVAVGVRRLGDVDALVEPVLEAHLEAARRAFKEERSPDGQGWAPLASSTLRRGGPRAGILERTGVMRSSLRAVADGSGGAVGSPLPRAVFALRGTRTQPARRFVGPISDGELEELVREHVREAVSS